MVYRMDFFVDGGCRGNGQPGSIGAAAAVLQAGWSGRHYSQTTELRRDFPPWPTSQRAEITAVILALKWALQRWRELDGSPVMRVTVHSDSRYAVGCMTEWLGHWQSNGWRNARGVEVANRDLIEEAAELDDELGRLGTLHYVWVPRKVNAEADRYCNETLDL
ncbi:ribonuclease H-like domain-containing protein [Xylariaceae sp. FL0804]|nr:ribonuclease H-like domain-containing protein [Xylariaceae sp. FL0804]